MNGQKSTAVNAILLTLVGLLIGFIGGYWIGQRGQGAAVVANGNLAAASSTTYCPHQLDAKDQWIIAGFRCPNTDTVQAALLGCHCNVAHGIEDKIKSELAGGKSGDQIRAELITEYGERLRFRGQTGPLK